MSQTGIRKAFMKHWFAIEAIPIYAIIGSVLAGGSWYLYRLSMGPTIQWTKSNPTPWNSIKPNQTTKILTINHQAESSWSRDRL